MYRFASQRRFRKGKGIWWKQCFIKICFDRKYPVFVYNRQYPRRHLSQCWDEMLVTARWRPIKTEVLSFSSDVPKTWANSQQEPRSHSLCCGHVKSSQKFSTEQEQFFLMCLVFWMRKSIQETRLMQTSHVILRHPLPSSIQPFEWSESPGRSFPELHLAWSIKSRR